MIPPSHPHRRMQSATTNVSLLTPAQTSPMSEGRAKRPALTRHGAATPSFGRRCHFSLLPVSLGGQKRFICDTSDWSLLESRVA